ncbi:hypothetical protein LIER_20166 [Lithospermum erythrorhizon]|uniref:Integrase catalytic domain-containing protein n=1 Tax=Lithospermum erythrorhizon TaxID=34254 RepID=A0AAV3QMS9_LITER
MPFGLSNAPTTFQSIMNHVFNTVLRKFVLVLTLLREHKLFAKPSKCAFGQSHIEYLGYIISARGVQADPSKIEAMISWSKPNNLKSLRGFLGLTGYYRTFVQNYALLDFRKPFVIETDASGKRYGPVLMQEQKPLAYISKAWGLFKQAYQQSLKHLLEQKVTTYLRQKVVSKLLGLDYMIQYKQGKENVVADALSKAQHEEGQLLSISTVQPSWMHEVTSSYLQDKELQHILATIVINPAVFPLYDYKGGILRYKHKVVLGNDQDMKHKVIEALHDSTIGGYLGVVGAYQRIKALFYWKGMKKEIADYVTSCSICQQSKHELTQINMDFIEGLPTSNKKNAILVMVYRFTKYSHFIALSHPFTALKVAQLFLNHIHKLHGMPTYIISDRVKVFLSAMWQELFTKLGTKLQCSTSYHPQTDGQTERVNQCLETYLRCMCSARPKDWSNWLPMAEFWYNTSFHSSLKLTPFEALYGYKPPHLPAASYLKEVQTEARDMLEQRKQLTVLIKENLTLAQERMKRFADHSRTDRTLEVGEQVYLKLQPYRQNSVALRKHLKLAAKYYGPFEVLEEIGPIAYKLQLLEDLKIHPVFHVSLLKKHVKRKLQTTNALPTQLHDGSCSIYPLAILNKRKIKRAGTHIYQVLIQ